MCSGAHSIDRIIRPKRIYDDIVAEMNMTVGKEIPLDGGGEVKVLRVKRHESIGEHESREVARIRVSVQSQPSCKTD